MNGFSWCCPANSHVQHNNMKCKQHPSLFFRIPQTMLKKHNKAHLEPRWCGSPALSQKKWRKNASLCFSSQSLPQLTLESAPSRLSPVTILIIYNLSTPSTFDGGRARDRLLTRITGNFKISCLNGIKHHGTIWNTIWNRWSNISKWLAT